MTKSEILKVAKPILFNTEMVRAILDGRKTMTRQVIKPQPQGHFEVSENPIYIYDTDFSQGKIMPPYQTGDILYVRETWYLTDCLGLQNGYIYKASVDERQLRILEKTTGIIPKWYPSIHMPKEVARIFLKVTDVRVERLQDMTEDDAIKEGFVEDSIENDDTNINFMCSVDCLQGTAKGKFAFLWNKTIKKQDMKMYGWDADPLVWTIEFERVGA